MLRTLSFVALLLMLVGMLGLLATHSLFSPSPVAIAIQCAGFALMVWARVTFGGRSLHAGPDPTAGGLVTTGPYHFIRHPIYTAACAIGWTGVLANWSLLAAVFGILLAAVLESTFPSLPFYWRPYPLPHLLLRASQIVYPAFERELRPIRAAAQLKAKPHVLLIHGHADSITPVHVGNELQAAMSGHGSVELWTVPEADHNMALKARRDDYAERVTGFIRRALA